MRIFMVLIIVLSFLFISHSASATQFSLAIDESIILIADDLELRFVLVATDGSAAYGMLSPDQFVRIDSSGYTLNERTYERLRLVSSDAAGARFESDFSVVDASRRTLKEGRVWASQRQYLREEAGRMYAYVPSASSRCTIGIIGPGGATEQLSCSRFPQGGDILYATFMTGWTQGDYRVFMLEHSEDPTVMYAIGHTTYALVRSVALPDARVMVPALRYGNEHNDLPVEIFAMTTHPRGVELMDGVHDALSRYPDAGVDIFLIPGEGLELQRSSTQAIACLQKEDPALAKRFFESITQGSISQRAFIEEHALQIGADLEGLLSCVREQEMLPHAMHRELLGNELGTRMLPIIRFQEEQERYSDALLEAFIASSHERYVPECEAPRMYLCPGGEEVIECECVQGSYRCTGPVCPTPPHETAGQAPEESDLEPSEQPVTGNIFARILQFFRNLFS